MSVEDPDNGRSPEADRGPLHPTAPGMPERQAGDGSGKVREQPSPRDWQAQILTVNGDPKPEGRHAGGSYPHGRGQVRRMA